MRGCAVLIFLLSRKWRTRATERQTLAKLVLRLELFFLTFVFMGVGYALSERASPSDATWLVWQTITTVGYGDMPPKSALGRASVMVAGLAGILLLPFIVASATEYREEKHARRRLGMDGNPFKNGYVLFNLRDEDHIRTIVQELRVVSPRCGVCIVADNMAHLPEGVTLLPDIHFIRGSILDKSTYERARLRDNRQVIVFPHDPGAPASDASTRVIVDKVLDFVGDRVPVMHFLVDPDNAWLFDDCHSTSIYTGMALYAAIQECHDPGSAHIIQRLLSNRQGANPHTAHPRRIVGWTWQDLVVHSLSASRAMGAPVNPLALVNDGVPDPCPPPDAEITENSVLSLITPVGFDYTRFEEELVRCRERR